MIHVLEGVPWNFRHPAIQYWKNEKIFVYKGNFIPPELLPYASVDFSYARWKEDELNGVVQTPERSPNRFSLRDHQVEAARKIVSHYIKGSRGFLIADKTGLGKTLSCVASVAAAAKQNGFSTSHKAKVLIVCPKSVMATWRNTIQAYPVMTGFCRPMIINYQSMQKLVEAPAAARMAKKTRTKNNLTAKEGKSLIDWDYIIFDESQYLKNYPSSNASKLAEKIAKLDKRYIKGRSPFVIYSTATVGSSPLNLAIMAGIVGPLIDPNSNPTPGTWGQFLAEHDFNVVKQKSGWVWKDAFSLHKNSSDSEQKSKYEEEKAKYQKLREKDTKVIGKALRSDSAPFIMRSPTNIAGWPEQQIIPLPIAMDPESAKLYKKFWEEFKEFLLLPPGKKTSQSLLAETIRYRQKASLLKVDPMIEIIANMVESGNQVYVSCEFKDSIDRYEELLKKQDISISRITGQTIGSEREQQRLLFQKGVNPVIISSIPEGISFHALETLPDGSRATKATRDTIIHDLGIDPNKTVQKFGRAHRDGQNSNIFIPYLEKTVEEKDIARFVTKEGNMKTMTGEEDPNALQKIFLAAASDSTPPRRYS